METQFRSFTYILMAKKKKKSTSKEKYIHDMGFFSYLCNYHCVILSLEFFNGSWLSGNLYDYNVFLRLLPHLVYFVPWETLSDQHLVDDQKVVVELNYPNLYWQNTVTPYFFVFCVLLAHKKHLICIYLTLNWNK